MNARFPRQVRVRARAEFDRAFQQGRRTASPLFSLHFVAGPPPARLGLAVSRKVDPHAVGRNRIKRVLRDAFRRLRPQLADGDYVVVARKAAADSENKVLREDFMSLLKRAGTVPQAGLAGPSPPAAHAAPPSHPNHADQTHDQSTPARTP